jgi:hypothetical protein
MGESWQVDGHKVIEVGSADQAVRRLKVTLVGGRVDVVAHAEPEGRLEVHSVHGRPLDVTWDGETLQVGHPQARWDSLLTNLTDWARGGERSLDDRAELSLAVPAGVDLQIGTVSAEGLVVALTGKVEVRTVSGEVTLDGISGPVHAHSVSGSVEARGQSGQMRMDSVSGSFTVQSAGAQTLSAKTVSGSLHVDALEPKVTVTFGSVSGALVVRQPGESRGYDAELRSVSGRIVVGSQQVRGDFGSVKHRQRDRGATMTVRASTVSGDITLLESGGGPGADPGPDASLVPA